MGLDQGPATAALKLEMPSGARQRVAGIYSDGIEKCKVSVREEEFITAQAPPLGARGDAESEPWTRGWC